ncbi:hypothetical protein SB861_49130 [Paraburkholderia sp. SIMBA_049]
MLDASVALTLRLQRRRASLTVIASFDRAPAQKVTLGAQHGAVELYFNVDDLAVTETDPFGKLLRTKRFALLREDATSGQREAVRSDALSAAVAWAKERKLIVAGDPQFPSEKESDGATQPHGANVLRAALRKIPATY